MRETLAILHDGKRIFNSQFDYCCLSIAMIRIQLILSNDNIRMKFHNIRDDQINQRYNVTGDFVSSSCLVIFETETNISQIQSHTPRKHHNWLFSSMHLEKPFVIRWRLTLFKYKLKEHLFQFSLYSQIPFMNNIM